MNMLRPILVILISFASYTSARAQWSEPVRIGAPGGGYYPRILSQGDTLHVVYNNNNNGWKISYLRSMDGGDTWSGNIVLSDTVNTTQTHYPRIIANGDSLIAIWMCYFWEGSHNYNIGFRISNDNGLTWEPPEYAIDPGWTFPFKLSASGHGSTVNIMASGAPGDTMIFFNIRSTNFGESWLNPMELFTAAQSSLPDQAGINDMVHYVWGGRFDMERKWETYYMKSTDQGISWSENTALSEEDEYHSYSPSISADSQGNLAVSWFDYKYSPYFLTGDILLRQSPDSGSFWLPERQITHNHLAMGQSDVVCSGDTIDITWEDLGGGLNHRSIYYSRSVDYGLSWSEPYWIDGTDDDSWNPAMSAGDGKAYVVWMDGREDPGMALYFSRYDNQTDVIDEEPPTLELDILGIYPNPFNSRVAVSLNMEKGGDAEITIYDVSGRLVKRLFKGGNLEKGTHEFAWDATDAEGKAVSSGLYFAVASTPQGKMSQRLTLIR
jgi:hypothetical protein